MLKNFCSSAMLFIIVFSGVSEAMLGSAPKPRNFVYRNLSITVRDKGVFAYLGERKLWTNQEAMFYKPSSTKVFGSFLIVDTVSSGARTIAPSLLIDLKSGKTILTSMGAFILFDQGKLYFDNVDTVFDSDYGNRNYYPIKLLKFDTVTRKVESNYIETYNVPYDCKPYDPRYSQVDQLNFKSKRAHLWNYSFSSPFCHIDLQFDDRVQQLKILKLERKKI